SGFAIILHLCFAVLGGFFWLFPLMMGHAIENTAEPSTTLAISQGLLMANGLGQTIGPLVAGPLVGLFGPRGLPLYFLVVLSAVAVFTAWRMRVGVTVVPETQGKHVFVRTTTPAGTALDPRVPD
ncbi:MAG: hypothetical protein KDE20_23600, partial [Caldilineaceae bacterium]|nr:hypothetical protein [Caldilineaceae bacterium]